MTGFPYTFPFTLGAQNMTGPTNTQTGAGKVQELFAGSPIGVNIYGGIYFLPLDADIPTDAHSPLPAEAVHLGFVSEDGITITTDRSGDPTIAWGGDKVAYLQSSYGISWNLKLLQFFSADVARFAYGNANVAEIAANAEHGKQLVIKQNSQMLDMGCFVIDSFYGVKKVREVAPYARPTELGDLTLVHTELSAIEGTIELFPDNDGNAAYRYTDDGIRNTGGGLSTRDYLPPTTETEVAGAGI